MKHSLLFTVFFLSLWVFPSRAQWVVHDPINYLTNLNNYVQQVRQYTQMLQDYRELVKQSEHLGKAFEGGGLWNQTFAALSSIGGMLSDVRDVVSAVQARDAYNLIKYLPVDETWRENIKTVIDDAHGLVPDVVFDEMIEILSQRNPALSELLKRTRNSQMATINHRMNSYYYVSSRKEHAEKRQNKISTQKSTIASFGDNSQGQATMMLNSQLLLITQQNEELINGIKHIIMTQNDDFMDKQKIIEMSMNQMILESNKRLEIDPLAFEGFDF
ncbi:MAG: hypothetical protein ACSHWU_07650 [Marinicella sp.]